jgi:chromosome segregation ATPase
LQLEVDVKEMEEGLASGEAVLQEAQQQLQQAKQAEASCRVELAQAVEALRGVEEELGGLSAELDECRQKQQVGRAAGLGLGPGAWGCQVPPAEGPAGVVGPTSQ